MSKSPKKPVKQVRIVEDPNDDLEPVAPINEKADNGINEADLVPNADDSEDALI